MANSMITHCPECATRFQVTQAQLDTARGLVRCGHCMHVFSAAQYLEPEEPTPAHGDSAPSDAIPSAPRLSESRPATAGEPQVAAAGLPTKQGSGTALGASIPEAPLELRQSKPKRSLARRFFALLLCLLALAGLAGQHLWFERQELARDPRFKPYYDQACSYLDCQLTQRRAPELIRNHELVVRTHNRYDNALILDLLIENQAPFEQPFPLLEVSFSDLGGNLMAQRRFQPAEYLGGDLDPDGMMPRQQPIQLSLELLHPGQEAVNYRIRFLADSDQP